MTTDPRTPPAPPTVAHGQGGENGLCADRAEVHQATGVILVQLGIPAQDAFVRLWASLSPASGP